MAARLPSAPRARHAGSPDLEDHRGPPARTGHGGADRRRGHGGGRHPRGRQARQGGRPAGRHGRASRCRAGGRALQVDAEGDVGRPGDRRHARVRARQSHGHAHGGGDGALAHASGAPGNREVHLPAGGGRARRRRADGQGRRAGEPESGRRVRTARRPVHLRDDCLPLRSADGERPTSSPSRLPAGRRTAPCRGAAWIPS